MLEDINESFHRCFPDLAQIRAFGSKNPPAAHQAEALESLESWFEKRETVKPQGVILVLPTGAGKTFVAARFLCSGPISRGYKVLWLAHTHHLLEQAFFTFCPPDEKAKRVGYVTARVAEPKSSLSVRVVSGTKGHFDAHEIKAEDDVVIATLQTIARAFRDPKQLALKEFLKSSGGKLFVVFDEAHHSPAPSYRRLIMDMRSEYPSMCLLGLTATPRYHDEKKAGWLSKIYPQDFVYEISAQELIARGILAKPIFEEPATAFTPQFNEGDYQKWINSYRDLPENIITQLADNRERNEFIVKTYLDNRQKYGKTIIFADRWFQCDMLKEMLTKRGVEKVDVVYSHVDADPGNVKARNARAKDENGLVLEKFRKGELEVVINVRMLTEGTDVPDVHTVFLTRQTTSPTLLAQMVGRALRGPAFGGTNEAYIVAFIDNWKQFIKWAEYDQLADGLADEEIPEYGKRPPLKLISIELVRRLARQLDTGFNITPGPFLSLMPIGWYRVEFQALIEDTDESETVRQLVMVMQDQEEGYKSFIQHLREPDLEMFSEETVPLEAFKILGQWRDKFFSQATFGEENELANNLLHVARHMGQNEGSPPVFFPFSDRDEHDLDKVAQCFSFERNLDPWGLDKSLEAEYCRADRYWRAIYHNYQLFKSQYDACVNGILWREKTSQSDLNHTSTSEMPQTTEPSEEVKKQVKARDGYQCLCCGEKTKSRLQIDHVAPQYYGGNNSLENLQTLCKVCNGRKGIQDLNFRNHRTILKAPSVTFTYFETPIDSGSTREWKKYLRRCINFFYQCSAVQFVETPGEGQYGREWYVYLYDGNDPRWLQPFLVPLLQQVNGARKASGFQEKWAIRVDAPDQDDIRADIGKDDSRTSDVDQGEINHGVTAYCPECQEIRRMLNPKKVKWFGKSSAVEGACATCGNYLRIIKTAGPFFR